MIQRKIINRSLVMAAAGVCTLLASAVPAGATDLVTKFSNVNSNLCLEVYQSSTDDGAAVDQWGCNGTATQSWRIVPVGTSGYVTIVNVNSNKCLEVLHSITTDGAVVDQYGCNGTATQQWTIAYPQQGPLGPGPASITNRNSGKLLEVYQSKTTWGAAVDQWYSNGTNTQLWQQF